MEDDDYDVSPQSMDSGFFSPTPSANASFFEPTTAAPRYPLDATSMYTTLC